MRHIYNILIVEDDAIIALALELAALDAGWTVIGPFGTVHAAMHAVTTQGISAAVLDANLIDGEVTQLALHLRHIGVPFVVHSATGVPTDLNHLPVCAVTKPARAAMVIAKLGTLMAPHEPA